MNWAVPCQNIYSECFIKEKLKRRKNSLYSVCSAHVLESGMMPRVEHGLVSVSFTRFDEEEASCCRFKDKITQLLLVDWETPVSVQ